LAFYGQDYTPNPNPTSKTTNDKLYFDEWGEGKELQTLELYYKSFERAAALNVPNSAAAVA